eukprot:6061071-Ditylum_brightwellii.AAC.1
MTDSATNTQWHSSAVNHQNGVVLLVLDPKLEGYETSELYQWEMCVQLSAQGATKETPTNKIRNKVKYLILKLEETH